MAEAEQQQPTDAGTCYLNRRVVLIRLFAGTDYFLLRHAARKVLLRLDDGTLIGASTTLGITDASTPAVALDPVEAFAAGKLAPGAVTKLEELLRKFGEKFPTRHLRTVDLKRRASDAFNAVSAHSLLPTPPAPSGPGDSPARSMDVSTQSGGAAVLRGLWGCKHLSHLLCRPLMHQVGSQCLTAWVRGGCCLPPWVGCCQQTPLQPSSCGPGARFVIVWPLMELVVATLCWCRSERLSARRCSCDALHHPKLNRAAH